jgi:hypothetical protein
MYVLNSILGARAERVGGKETYWPAELPLRSTPRCKDAIENTPYVPAIVEEPGIQISGAR